VNATDELEQYLAGGCELGAAYAREPKAEPPQALDRAVLVAARVPRGVRSPCLAPLGLAATMLLSITVLSMLVLKPRAQPAQTVRVMPVNYSSDGAPGRAPDAWLAEIAALRRAHRDEEAARQMHRFRLAYPRFPAPSEE
jgi:hypothetical protein